MDRSAKIVAIGILAIVMATTAGPLVANYMLTQNTVNVLDFANVMSGINTIYNDMQDTMRRLNTALEQAKQDLYNYTDQAIANALDAFNSSVWTNITQYVNSVVQPIYTYINSRISEALDAFNSSVWTNIVQYVNSVVQPLYNYIDTMVNRSISDLVANLIMLSQFSYRLSVSGTQYELRNMTHVITTSSDVSTILNDYDDNGIIIMPGTYNAYSPITLRTGSRLFGIGNPELRTAADMNILLTLIGEVEVEHMTVNGSRTTSQGAAIQINTGSKAYLHDLIIISKKVGITGPGYVGDSELEKIKIYQFGDESFVGIQLIFTDSLTARDIEIYLNPSSASDLSIAGIYLLQAVRCVFSDVKIYGEGKGYGIKLYQNSENNIFYQFYVENFNRGVDIYGSSSNNFFDTFTITQVVQGIYVSSGNYNSFTHGKISNWTNRAAYFATGTKWNTISTVTITPNSISGILDSNTYDGSYLNYLVSGYIGYIDSPTPTTSRKYNTYGTVVQLFIKIGTTATNVYIDNQDIGSYSSECITVRLFSGQSWHFSQTSGVTVYAFGSA